MLYLDVPTARDLESLFLPARLRSDLRADDVPDAGYPSIPDHLRQLGESGARQLQN